MFLLTLGKIVSDLWIEVKSIENKAAVTARKIHGIHSKCYIANLFSEKFGSITACDAKVTTSDSNVTHSTRLHECSAVKSYCVL